MAKSTYFLLFMIVALCSPAFADMAPDNSGNNKRVEKNQELNAQDQGNSKSDVELTRQIRRTITKSKDFSTDARNVKIITLNGHVTLKGPVKSEDEKLAITKIATDIAGASNVTNHIVIE
jgi:osmotically-inducible protein OsmY